MNGVIDHTVRQTRRVAHLEDAIGNTPLVSLRHIVPRGGPAVLAKLEGQNPGGSVKARAAAAIIRAGERDGRLGTGRTLLDASSGNTGIAYAMLCAERGYACEICLPAGASEERKKLLRVYGARLVITPAEDGSDGAIREARRRAAANPEQYFYADQYNNPANARAHYEGTGVEIWRDTHGRITHFIAGLGTTGTFVGTGKRLRAYDPSIELIAVQPDSAFHGIEGMKHVPSAIVPGLWDPALPDRIIEVETENAQAMARRLAREEGLLTGVSGGAAVAATLLVAESLSDDAVLVTVLPDSGERYLSEPWLSAE
jgi:cysteine synthase B